MVIVLSPDGSHLSVRRAGPWMHLRMLLSAGRLDAELAAGVSPEATVLHAAHAQRIVRPAACAALADGLRRVLVASAERPPRISCQAAIARREVQAAADQLWDLADRLERMGPIRAEGVAAARWLIEDGTGPLYLPAASSGALRARTKNALALL